MTMNVWIDETTGIYNIKHEGDIYTRTDYLSAKELIEGLLGDMSTSFKEKRLDRTLYA